MGPYELILDLKDYSNSAPQGADELMNQVSFISRRSFDENIIRDWSKLQDRVLTVMVDAARKMVFGYCLLGRMETEFFYIDQFAIAGERRGMGLGRKLMLRMLDKARECGYKGVHLFSTKFALGFYVGLGFKRRTDALEQMLLCDSLVCVELLFEPDSRCEV